MQSSVLYQKIIEFLGKQEQDTNYFCEQFDFFSQNTNEFGKPWVEKKYVNNYKDVRNINIAPKTAILDIDELDEWYSKIFPNELIQNMIIIQDFKIIDKINETGRNEVLRIGKIYLTEHCKRGIIDEEDNVTRVNSMPLELRLIEMKFFPTEYFARENQRNGNYNSYIPLGLLPNFKF